MDFDSAHINEDTAELASETTDLVATPKQKPVVAYDGAATTRDRYTKKVFVLDRSASMRDTICARAELACLVWPDEFFEWAEKRIENAAVRVDALATLDEDEELSNETKVPHSLENEDTDEDENWAALRDVISDRDAIRQAVLSNNLTAPFELDRPFSVSKADLVKAVVARTVRERVRRYPDAEIVGIMFDDRAHLIQVRVTDNEGVTKRRATTPEELIAIVQQDDFHGGGTNITKAVGAAVSLCKRAPSKVHQHHIVLVTDGCDYGITEVVQYLDDMQTKHICLDVIHITENSGDAGEFFKDVCTRTGGEYQQADNVNDFQTRFLTAANRLMLTAGGAQ